MTSATSLEIDQIIKDNYVYLFLKHVHMLLETGHQTARYKLSAQTPEEDISGYFRDAIDTYVQSIDAPEWCDGFAVHNERPERSAQRTGKRRKRTDLVFERTCRPRIQVVFEAKRLDANHSASLYCGTGGLECFTTAAYASTDGIAGMLGYVQDHDIAYWNEKVLDTITRHQTYETHTCPDVLLAGFPHEWSSTHIRMSMKSILIYHLMLECF